MFTARNVLSSLLCAASIASALQAADEMAPSLEGIQFFEAKIRPLLVENCYRCHSAEGEGIRGGLAVDNRDALHAGGESGPAIVPSDLDASLLWNAINYRDLKMPPRKPLSKQAIEDVRQWIEMGAPDPRVSTQLAIKSSVTTEDIEKGRQFWAFKKPLATKVEDSASWAWAKSEIDRFVESKYQANGLEPADDADALTLVRRLYFDLIGLPPTSEEIHQFEAAYNLDRDLAIANTIDELLEKPQFGERWGRFWLDIARYAESTGKEVDMTFPNAWRYRDYVIDAFNHDKPYDQFVREQIAGDLLPAKTDAEWSEHLIATGFLALGPKALIERNPRQFQADLIDEQIDATTRVILGVSVACARCHDHKFDPIPQTDYYALAGIFQSTETLFGGARSQRNRQPSNLVILPVDDPNPNDVAISKTELTELKKQLREREQEYDEARRAQRQPATAKDKPGSATDPRRKFLNAAIIEQIVVQLTNKINSVDANGKPLTFCMGVQESSTPRNARLMVRGEIDQPAQEVPRGFVQVLCDQSPALKPTTSGRLEFAHWLASRENPLTARVMVNRIWQHLIGLPIVRETENFGASGPGATHPELLDSLALNFMDNGWSIKSVIRQIATSRVYRLSSAHNTDRLERDPENKFVARGNPRRLDAEAMRDALLYVSGQLELERPRGSAIASFGSTLIGPNGPAVIPPQLLTSKSAADSPMAGMMYRGLGSRGRGAANPLDAPNYYRSAYLPVARNMLPRALDVFDFAEPSMVIGQREVSHTADQALFMLNNPFVIEQSDALARRLIRESKSPEDHIVAAFEMVFGRAATNEEKTNSRAFLESLQSKIKLPSSDQRAFAALSQFCQALFSTAEFRYVN